MTCVNSHSFSPRLTVAKRKEALELRKTMKPLMEKRRRARINDSLDHLKSLIIPLTGKDVPLTATKKAIKRAWTACPLCCPKPAWTKARASALTSSSSSPPLPPSPRPAATAVPRAPWLSPRSSRDS
uniref:Hes family bHLH transcription factor 2 n=1 Tax=Gadus morhua TaxID=8049 RepID=A0A8C5CHP0_GADMO